MHQLGCGLSQGQGEKKHKRKEWKMEGEAIRKKIRDAEMLKLLKYLAA